MSDPLDNAVTIITPEMENAWMGCELPERFVLQLERIEPRNARAMMASAIRYAFYAGWIASQEPKE